MHSLIHPSLEEKVKSSLNSSIQALGTKPNTVLIHDYTALQKYGSSLLDLLEAFQQDQYFEQLGISVYTPNELAKCLNLNRFKVIQIPFNILDWRFSQRKTRDLLVAYADQVQFHIRSVFLQGILISSPNREQTFSDLKLDLKEARSYLEKLTKDLGRIDIADLALSYVRGFDFYTRYYSRARI